MPQNDKESDKADILPVTKPIPRHVAIIMDGNGRWAKQRKLPRYAGHREGVKAVRRIVEACKERKIEALTLFAFSSENWRRPKLEVGLLMDLFMRTLRKEVQRLDRNGVQLRFIGDRTAFGEKLRAVMDEAEQTTAHNSDLKLVIAANYGGRWDIVQAAKKLAVQVAEKQLSPDDIDIDRFASEICSTHLPEPDLFIRSGGEQRISNYLLWQLAYTELYFTDLLWPDFDADALDSAIQSFANRQRRFGQTGDQVEQTRRA
ncbi:MAG: isoprenyl transferase [Gammaproteobacteria bacterium]